MSFFKATYWKATYWRARFWHGPLALKRGSFDRESWEQYLKALAKQKEEEEEKKKERLSKLRALVEDAVKLDRTERRIREEKSRKELERRHAGVLVAVMNVWDDEEDWEAWE